MLASWRDLIFNPKARIAIPAVIFVVATLLVVRYIYSRPVVFESKAKIWIQTKVATQQGVSPFFNSPIATAAEVMKSSVVLDEAVKHLKAELPAGELVNLDMLRGTKIIPVAETDVLEISYQHANPKVACEIVRAIVDSFVQVSTVQSAAIAVQQEQFLEKKLASDNQTHRAKSEALKQFQQSINTVDVSQASGALAIQVHDLKVELLAAQAELGVVRSRASSLTEELGMSQESAIAAQKVSQDEVLHQLGEKYNAYQVALADSKGRYADDSLKMVRLRRSIERTKNAMDERRRSQFGSLQISTDAIIGEKSDKREKILDRLTLAKQEEAGIERKIKELQLSINGLAPALHEFPAAQAKYSDLTRAEKVAADSISESERSLRDAQLTESIARESSNVQVIDLPEVANRPESANGKKIFAVAEALLLVFCAGLFYILGYLDPHVYSTKKLVKLIPASVVGGLGKGVFARSIASIPILHRLRLTLEGWLNGHQFAVVGPDRAEGKTTVACGLALSFASSGKRVLLIDADLEHPSINRLFGVSQSPGLSDFATTRNLNVLDKAMIEVRPNLFVIPAGGFEPDCILEGALLQALLGFARANADVVIFDTALSKSDSTLALLSKIQKVIVTARLGHSQIETVKGLAANLLSRNCDVLLVPTNVREADITSVRMSQSSSPSGSLVDEAKAGLVSAAW